MKWPKSGYLGIYWNEPMGKWRVYVNQTHVGYYQDLKKAVKARNRFFRTELQEEPPRKQGAVQTPHTGISYRYGKWRARICHSGVKKDLGYYQRYTDAVDAYNACACKLGLNKALSL